MDDIIGKRAETGAHELAQKGIDAIPITADVTQADQVQMVIDAVMQKWGRLTIGVNNAGVAGWFAAETMPEVTDLQGAVVYLAAEVSDFMTGCDLIIDDGFCAW